ncbi:aldo/keto reductase [Kitasatospora cinereorecta]|uniref:Aldo/keto reductase n=1 Tax=Kitasatospora cinereorecta TaxID=285560 RepID=A0ABW0V5P6_9ACTN
MNRVAVTGSASGTASPADRGRPGHRTVRVGEFSFATAAIGNLRTPDGDLHAEQTVDAAWKSGIRHFDTSPHYGRGRSERRLGRALRGRPRDEYTLSTRAGCVLDPAPDARGRDRADGLAGPAAYRRRRDFSAEGIRRSVEESLNRLGLDRIDLVYLPDPDDRTDQAPDHAYPALERLRAEGVIGAIGLAVDRTEQPDHILRDTDLDVLLLIGRYTLLDQRGLAGLLLLAAERGVAVVVGGVFNSGLLAAPGPETAFDYAPAHLQLLEQEVELRTVCERYGVPLRAAALRFPFGHPAVARALVGTRSAREVRDAVAMLHCPVPDALWTELKARRLLPAHVPTPKQAG